MGMVMALGKEKRLNDRRFIISVTHMSESSCNPKNLLHKKQLTLYKNREK
jgi:hypothetical protein